VEGDVQLVLVKKFRESLNIPITTLIKIITAEVDLRVDSVLDSEVGPMKKHGVRDIDLDDGHGGFPRSLPSYNTLKPERQSDEPSRGLPSITLRFLESSDTLSFGN